MVMTHYMQLLSLHQPWNLIIFMLVPMVLAETILAAGIFTLFYKDKRSETCQSCSHNYLRSFFYLCCYLSRNIVYSNYSVAWSD